MKTDQYKRNFFWLGLFAFFLHGAKLSSRVIGVDTEDLIHLQNDFYAGWLATGRQGLVFLKWISGSMQFNPYFSGAVTLIFLVLCAAAFFLLWERAFCADKPQTALLFGLFLWMAHPILAEQFYFSLQSAEICIGLLCTAASVYLTGEAKTQENPHRKRLMYALAFAGALLSFCIYQIFVAVFLFAVLSVLLPERMVGERGTLGEELREIFPYAAVFLGAFLVNTVITKLFFAGSEYLDHQINWLQKPAGDCLRMIRHHVRLVFCGGDGVFYSVLFGLLAAAGLLLICLFVKKNLFAVLFYYLCLLTTPFLMTVLCGGAPAVRSQLVLPLLTGYLFYLDVRLAGLCQKDRWRKFWTVSLFAVGIFGAIREADTTLRLYYTDACRFAEDEAVGRELIRALEPLIGEDNTPIVVVGSREFRGNNACVRGELIGHSIFEQDVEEEPRFYWSTRRCVGFLHTLGYDCEQMPDKNVPYAVKFARDMGIWPRKHSVEHAGDMIVIKMGDVSK